MKVRESVRMRKITPLDFSSGPFLSILRTSFDYLNANLRFSVRNTVLDAFTLFSFRRFREPDLLKITGLFRPGAPLMRRLHSTSLSLHLLPRGVVLILLAMVRWPLRTFGAYAQPPAQSIPQRGMCLFAAHPLYLANSLPSRGPCL